MEMIRCDACKEWIDIEEAVCPTCSAVIWENEKEDEVYTNPTAGEVNRYLGGQSSFWSTKDKPGSQTTGSYNSSYPIAGYQRCSAVHDGSEYIFKHGEKTIGGARGKGIQFKYSVMVVDLAGDARRAGEDIVLRAAKASKFVKSGPTEMVKTLSEKIPPINVSIPPIIELDWNDMGVPPVGLEFWETLWALLPDGHTTFACIGSHGRTGTALAVMMLAADRKMSSVEAINRVRQAHCHHAIETQGQEDYIRRIARSRPEGDNIPEGLEIEGSDKKLSVKKGKKAKKDKGGRINA